MCALVFPVLGTEQEWKLAQSTVETASSGLSSATNELSIATLKAKSASGHTFFSTYTNGYILNCYMLGAHTHTSVLYILYICKSCETCWFLSFTGHLQSTVLAMSDCACEASVALGAYARVSNRHSTLTSECGSMLEEV